tara:strand:+ start:615 stop:1103 length:489 start_codon:yes stop_codon:yes gene_type:complete
VLRSIILADVYDGEGEKDETFYDTLYRFLVLFGVPVGLDRFGGAEGDKVFQAIDLGLNLIPGTGKGKNKSQYWKDCKKFSIDVGEDCRIALAREKLMEGEGEGMKLLKSLVCFNPEVRASSFDVLTSGFMSQLEQGNNNSFMGGDDGDGGGVEVRKFFAFAS